MQDIFEVEASTHLTGNQWWVIGRVWETIKCGETVYGAVGRSYKTTFEEDNTSSLLLEPEGGPILYPFRIVSISIMNIKVDQLEGGYTGGLVLEGEHGETLLDTKLLVRLS